MPSQDPATVLREIDAALDEYVALRKKAKHDDLSDQPDFEQQRVLSRLTHTAERFAPPGSYHLTRTREIRESSGLNLVTPLRLMPGLVRSLREDLAANRMQSVTEIVHAEVFSDFLDMAKHLLDNGGFKDAAAVVAGSALEAHIRALCVLNGIAAEDEGGRGRKADTLNAELHAAKVYKSKGDMKSVIAWLDTRNDAAHGHYTRYEHSQVNLMIEGIRDFLRRYPA